MTEPLTSSEVQEIHQALRSNQMVSLETHSNGQHKVKVHSFLSWLVRWPLGSYHRERIARIGAAMAATLQKIERTDDLESAWRHPTVQATRLFLKNISKSVDSDPRIIECRKQCLAYKIGIDAAVLDEPVNAGFADFAFAPPLERYLSVYGHNLKVDSSTREIQIIAGGSHKNWSEVKDILQPKQGPAGLPVQAWTYGPEGIQNENMYDWTELKPFKKGNPAEWNHQYIFEYCACCYDSPHKTGDHSWIRLKTPEGDIYSIGLYRPGKRSKLDNIKFPFRVKKGFLMQPDVSEFWPMPIHAIPIAITKEQFEQMKQTIEEDKKNDDQIFQLVYGNCSLYGAKIAKIGNINLPVKRSALRILTPAYLEPLIDAVAKKLPAIVNKIIVVAGSFFINLAQYFLGAGIVDKQVSRKRPDIKPHFTSIKDIFDPSKAEMSHPHTLGHHTRRAVMKWRNQIIAKLYTQLEMLPVSSDNMAEAAKIMANIRRVRFDIPPEYRLV